MSLVILEPNKVPPGHWIYIDPDTKTAFRESTIQAMIRKVHLHRNSNGLVFDHNKVIENICENSMPGLCGDPKEPSIARMAGNFMQSMAHWVKAGFKMANDETLQYRLDHCVKCEHWKGKRGGTLLEGGCKLCGCKGIKLALDTEHCPQGIW